MANFDKYSNYNENTSFSGVVFGANAPVLEVELNEMQQILNTKISRLLSVFGSGVVPLSSNSISFNTGNLTLTVSDALLLEKSGITAYIESASVVMTSINKVAYFKVQEVDATKATTLKSYGNTAGATVNNPIQDNRFPVETTRRKMVTYTLMRGETLPVNTDTEKYVLVGTYDSAESSFVDNKIGFDKVFAEVLSSVNPVFTGSLSLGRKSGTTVGTNSLAVGYLVTASGTRSIALGRETLASGEYCFAHGFKSNATGTGSFAVGNNAKSSGNYAFALGYNAETSGETSFALGRFLTALQNQLVIGHYNDSTLATQNLLTGAGTGTAFVIGNGSSSAPSNALRVQGDGAVYSKGAYNATGADYAEYVEWADGNHNNEDRRGYFVTFDEEKPNMIRKARATDIDILGVVSGNPCIIGNADECWVGKFLTDEFGNFIYETVEETIVSKDPETGETETKTIEVTRYKLNPDFDETQQYIQRSERPEWCAVGWIGVLAVREDGTCEVGGYCTWSDNGIATSAEPSRLNYRVVERVNESIVKVVIK